MATIITTLKTHTNQDTVYPNIRAENIPDGAVSATQLKLGIRTLKSLYDEASDFTEFVSSIWDIIDESMFYILRLKGGTYNRATVQLFTDEPQTLTLIVGETTYTIGEDDVSSHLTLLSQIRLLWVYSE